MMTRKALSRQEESQLQLTLQELKVSKELINQMNREREENEQELLDVLNRNSALKKDMAELHTQTVELARERDRLQLLIDGFDQCQNEYEQALRLISRLEQELCEANNCIFELESSKAHISAVQNQSLFDELVGSAPDMVSASFSNNQTVIDLTNDESIGCKCPKTNLKLSNKKLKKYIKINRYICKTKKLINKNKTSFKYAKNAKDRLQLIEQLDVCSSIIEENRIVYENNLKTMTNKIKNLHDSLNKMTQNYESSKNEIGEYILALKHLSCTSSGAQENNRCRSSLSGASGRIVPETLPDQSVCEPLLSSLCNNSDCTNENNSCTKKSCSKLVMFCDELGKNLGQLLQKNTRESIINYCKPGSTIDEIMKSIVKHKFNEDTNLIILIGNRGNVSKNQLMTYCNTLCSLKVKKIVMFTFPYSKSLPQVENNFRYNLNLSLNTMAYHSSQMLHIIDINKLLKNIILTKDKYYLPTYCKRQLALSLSFYFEHLASNLASITPAFIEQSIDIYKLPLEFVPSHNNNLFNQNDINLNTDLVNLNYH